ncbi:MULTISPECIES: hypothetical protein [unclassified Roseofilum]|uniref:hypothetical protein n=1 Tax=unclassified Roseofilum TaxID=2620099 RepID=UPI000E7F1C2B|nr:MULTISPECIES: hypothetical protein [unclassified Roseofilum]MBP0008488.1 diheme cytochrome C [Roseofilum sp. Belize Diploria]MBP0033016.1 diheme cytochrome C [Roseofilum sp. Belize BBD 4]HBQ99108.1 diheme cytochrome C [Cyanobacteria bacterium UBA11691]
MKYKYRQLFPIPYSLFPSLKRRSPLILVTLIFLWSVTLGWGLSTLNQPAFSQSSRKSVDLVPEQHQLGEELYRENCGSCHLALPPAVMPTETWRQLIQDQQHYGISIDPILNPGRLLVWKYIQVFSRPLLKDESTPYRLRNSRYFKALHPQVEFQERIELSQCVSCHPSAQTFNFRELTPEWE